MGRPRKPIWKTQQWPQDWKRSVLIPVPKKGSNALTVGQLHSSPMLVRSCLKSCRLGFSIMGTKNFQMSKLGLEKEEEVKWSESHSFVSDSLWPHGLYSPWNSLGQDTGVGRVSFSRGSSQLRDRTQVSCIAGGLYQLSHKESPKTEKLEIKLPTFAGL